METLHLLVLAVSSSHSKAVKSRQGVDIARKEQSQIHYSKPYTQIQISSLFQASDCPYNSHYLHPPSHLPPPILAYHPPSSFLLNTTSRHPPLLHIIKDLAWYFVSLSFFHPLSVSPQLALVRGNETLISLFCPLSSPILSPACGTTHSTSRGWGLLLYFNNLVGFVESREGGAGGGRGRGSCCSTTKGVIYGCRERGESRVGAGMVCCVVLCWERYIYDIDGGC